ncbi:hypothetical protein BP6252_10432 [Coleophoma cylindrospora]|uniref:EthD domain-containing protein n=1 Tax=Coleophoma cylindrospora TaxID=1849047 RepID=A0A3D8QSV2_9HELO|nr:hypothetical protein BP6252_10432 [Coleophoma cylindrospora]
MAATDTLPPKKYLKVSLFLTKLPELSDEQFHEYWRTKHLQLALENKSFSTKVRRYNQAKLTAAQHHSSASLKSQASEFGLPVVAYDGVAEVWVDDLNTWKEIVSDPDFAAAIASDEKKFMQRPIHVMLGYDELKIGKEVRE